MQAKGQEKLLGEKGEVEQSGPPLDLMGTLYESLNPSEENGQLSWKHCYEDYSQIPFTPFT